MTNKEMLVSAVNDINGLVIQGNHNWKLACSAIDKIFAVCSALDREDELREKKEKAELEDLKRRRAAEKAALETGEADTVGGETIHVNLLTGEQTVIE